MPSQSEDRFDNLDAGGQHIASVASRPASTVLVATVILLIASWVVLVSMNAAAVSVFGPDAAGPGSGLIALLPELPLPSFLKRFLALCLTPAPIATGGLSGFLSVAAMWFVMSIAMMLPSAAPMIRTYCEIADTAAARGRKVVHPGILVTGYLSVWIVASFAFAGVTAALQMAGTAPISPALPVAADAGAAALAIAGLYQFSGLKDACLEKCRNPFATLFAQWSERTAQVFKLGVEQGLFCLGCCWALMLVMFAVGVMNVAWMALLAVFTLYEKIYANRFVTRLTGCILLVWAAGLLFIRT